MLTALSVTGCNDWLTEPSPGTTDKDAYFSTGSGEVALYVTNAAYVPMAWEYNYTYYNEFFFGDVVSDDALKGGQNINDLRSLYDLENFKTNSNNDILLEYYRAQYQGIARCNLALQKIPLVPGDSLLTDGLRERLLGEAYFLRAMYYFRLVRLFGDVPKVDYVAESSEQWLEPRSPAEAVYDFIVQDLEKAEARLWNKSAYPPEDMGRATKGAAQAMLLKVHLYRKQFGEARRWGEAIIWSGEYSLVGNYADNFTLSGENGPESVFEIQYVLDPKSDYADPYDGQGGNGHTRGTFTTVLTRSRSAKLCKMGWGFNKPTQNLYEEYEAGDPRREVTILNPDPTEMSSPDEVYLGSPYLSRKSGMFVGSDASIPLDHASRGELNNKVIRYADVLLMYAEACMELGDNEAAIPYLNEVRRRARGDRADVLPDFPYGWPYGEDLRTAIRHERRVELAMEGHRWYDLCRWGIAKVTMDAYKERESPEVRTEMSEFIEGVHELFPIPSKEMEINPGLSYQNPGY
jgi:tetratricopeptide (TPR) repeat protein